MTCASKPTVCSFCGKSPAEVMKLIAGADGCICNYCIDACKAIMDKELGIDVQKAGGFATIQELKERVELLRQLRDGKRITAKDYRERMKQLMDRI